MWLFHTLFIKLNGIVYACGIIMKICLGKAKIVIILVLIILVIFKVILMEILIGILIGIAIMIIY